MHTVLSVTLFLVKDLVLKFKTNINDDYYSINDINCISFG